MKGAAGPLLGMAAALAVAGYVLDVLRPDLLGPDIQRSGGQLPQSGGATTPGWNVAR